MGLFKHLRDLADEPGQVADSETAKPADQGGITGQPSDRATAADTCSPAAEVPGAAHQNGSSETARQVGDQPGVMRTTARRPVRWHGPL